MTDRITEIAARAADTVGATTGIEPAELLGSAWEAANRAAGVRLTTPYIVKAARNGALDEVRRITDCRRTGDDGAARVVHSGVGLMLDVPDRSPGALVSIDTLHSLIDDLGLPEYQLQAALEVWGHGSSYLEAAKILGTTRSGIRNALHRVRQAIRRRAA